MGSPSHDTHEDDTPPRPLLRIVTGQFAKLLIVDTAIVDHLPVAYEEALHALYGNGLPDLSK